MWALLVVGCLFGLSRASHHHYSNRLTPSEEEADREFDPLNGHDGIFKSLPWTDFELAKISSYHATAEYYKIIDLVREKLIKNPEIEPHARRRIEKFLKEKRPPAFFKDMLNDDERREINEHKLAGELTEAMDIMFAALRKLTKENYDRAMRYFGFLQR